MATTAKIDLVRKSPGNLSGLPLDPNVNAGAINSGDLCYWTGAGVASLGTGLTLNAALIANMAKILGVSRDTNPLTAGGIINPIETVGIDASGAFGFKTTGGDTYAPFSEVIVGADAQTITLAPVGPPSNGAGLFTAAGTGGLLSAAAHVVTMTYITASGETPEGTPVTVTPTAGQNIVYDFDNAAAVVIPAWAIGFAIYVDHIFAAAFYVAPTADQSIANYASVAKAAPTSSSIAIGRIFLPQTNISPAVAAPTSLAGGTGIIAQVILNKPFPFALAL